MFKLFTLGQYTRDHCDMGTYVDVIYVFWPFVAHIKAMQNLTQLVSSQPSSEGLR